MKSLPLQGSEQNSGMLHRATYETPASMWFRVSYKIVQIEKERKKKREIQTEGEGRAEIKGSIVELIKKKSFVH